MDIQHKIGDRIRKLRQEKGLSHEKIANLCGLNRIYIASIKQGNRNISIVNLEKIARAFGFTLSELFEGL